MKTLTCAEYRPSSCICCWVLAGLLMLQSGALGQAPWGSYKLEEAAQQPLRLWDLTGAYPWDIKEAFKWIFDQEGIPWPWGDCVLSIDVIHDGKGKVTALDGTAPCSGDGSQLTVLYSKVKGSVKYKKGATTVRLSYKFSGTPGGTFEFPPIKGVVKVNLEVDPSSKTLVGTASTKVTVRGRGSAMWTDPWSLDLPEGMNGSFQLTMDMDSQQEKRLSGTGELSLSNNREFNLSLKGKYTAKKDAAKLSFKGSDGDSRGVTLRIHAAGPALTIDQLKSKALGQNIRLKGGPIGNLKPLSPPEEEDYQGTWSGLMKGRVGGNRISRTMIVVLEKGSSLHGLFYNRVGDDTPNPVSGTVDSYGHLSFTLGVAEPGDPDCHDWDVNGTARLNGDRSTMSITVLGTFCGAETGEASGIFTRQPDGR